MGAYGDSIATTVPQVGDAETTASAAVSTLLTEFKTRLTAKVTPSSITIDANLDFDDNAAINLSGAEFNQQAASPGAGYLWLKDDGEFYLTDSASNDVQVTSGGVLSIAATGAITGAGYGSGNVEVAWNSGGTNYQFKSGASTYAHLTASTLQLYDSTYTLSLDVATLSASYTMTLPAAVPASETMLSLDASGNVAVVDSSTPYSNFKHDSVIQPLQVLDADNTTWGSDYLGSMTNTTTSGSQRLSYKVTPPLKPGDVISAIKLYVTTNSNPDTVTIALYKFDGAGAWSTPDSTTTTSTGMVTFTLASPITIADNEQFYVKITHTGAASSSHQIDGCWAVYSRG